MSILDNLLAPHSSYICARTLFWYNVHWHPKLWSRNFSGYSDFDFYTHNTFTTLSCTFPHFCSHLYFPANAGQYPFDWSCMEKQWYHDNTTSIKAIHGLCADIDYTSNDTDQTQAGKHQNKGTLFSLPRKTNLFQMMGLNDHWDTDNGT